MSRLMPVNYDKVIKALTKLGYIVIHQKGSHIVMQLADKRKYASIFRGRNPEIMIMIPAHRPIGKGMVRTIMREAGISVDEFNRLAN
ncbi:MAG: type II toxin-antitoxin system HicA family toxin [Candidatus Marsarchaeota archaeon]|nr:type II toxin-antitoxin system HicA family toxin [Candidatus Marsarchaeota archaeon]MCL5431329.1 type II toxin-antitoxin system HicA family toxin [Candidatus Marsarchaeota archaeon]